MKKTKMQCLLAILLFTIATASFQYLTWKQAQRNQVTKCHVDNHLALLSDTVVIKVERGTAIEDKGPGAFILYTGGDEGPWTFCRAHAPNCDMIRDFGPYGPPRQYFRNGRHRVTEDGEPYKYMMTNTVTLWKTNTEWVKVECQRPHLEWDPIFSNTPPPYHLGTNWTKQQWFEVTNALPMEYIDVRMQALKRATNWINLYH